MVTIICTEGYFMLFGTSMTEHLVSRGAMKNRPGDVPGVMV